MDVGLTNHLHHFALTEHQNSFNNCTSSYIILIGTINYFITFGLLLQFFVEFLNLECVCGDGVEQGDLS
jgi:hypothetical protein